MLVMKNTMKSTTQFQNIILSSHTPCSLALTGSVLSLYRISSQRKKPKYATQKSHIRRPFMRLSLSEISSSRLPRSFEVSS
jgi:hypothetical protein